MQKIFSLIENINISFNIEGNKKYEVASGRNSKGLLLFSKPTIKKSQKKGRSNFIK